MINRLFKKKPKKHEKIRVLSTSIFGETFVAGEFEKRIQVWNVNGKLIQKFDTDLNTGNSQSVSISSNGNQLVVAGYDVNRITLFDTGTGKTLWQKSDLKKPYKVRILEKASKQIFVDTESKGCYILSLETGEIIEKLRWIKDLIESPYSDIMQLEKASSSIIFDQLSNSEIFKFNHRGSLLDSVFGRGFLICSYVGGPIEGMKLDSSEILWSTKSKGHFLRVGYNHSIDKVVAIRWDFEKGGSKFLAYLNSITGQIEKEIDLQEPVSIEFINNGELLITSQGRLFSTTKEEVIREFDFENN